MILTQRPQSSAKSVRKRHFKRFYICKKRRFLLSKKAYIKLRLTFFVRGYKQSFTQSNYKVFVNLTNLSMASMTSALEQP